MEENINTSTIELIKTTLDKIRPFIQRDGGDITYDSFEDGIVYVKLSGACIGCGLIENTLYEGVENIIMEEVPGVVAVRLADDKQKIKAELEKIKEENKK